MNPVKNQTNYLDAVIRVASEYTSRTTSAETIVVIDMISRQAIDQITIMASWTRTLKYFLVANDTDGQNAAYATIRLPYANGLPKDQKLSILLRYKATCRQGNEKRMAEALFDGMNPGVVFNDLLAKWVSEYLNIRLKAFTEDYPYEKTNLQAFLTTKAFKEVGLTLEPDISVEGLDALGSLILGPISFPVSFTDYDNDENLRIKLRLAVDEKSIVKAMLNQNISLTDLVRKTVEVYISENLSLHTFCYELNSERVISELKENLNQALRSVGRAIKSMVLEAETEVPRPYQKDLEIPYAHLEYPEEPIKIKISVLMMPQNIAKYRAQKPSNLDSWVEETLREVTGVALFGAKYLDFLIRFKSLEEKIKKQMNYRAEMIGYHVEQLISAPYLEPLDWLKGINIEINQEKQQGLNQEETEQLHPDERQGLFQTNIPDCLVRLSAVVTARIKDLEGVAERLERRQNIPEEMRKAIHTCMAQYLRGINPERFYMRYLHTDQHHPEELPVEKELHNEIKALLQREFYAEVTHLTLLPGKTDVTDRLARLLKDSHEFKITLPLANFKSAETFIVTGVFRVESVHQSGWQRFQERDSSIEKIKKRIENSMQAELKPYGTRMLILKGQASLNKLKDKLLLAAKDLIRDEFGLVIHLSTVICSFTETEDDARRIIRLLERRAELEETLVELYISEESPEDIKEVIKQIANLNSLLESKSISGIGDRAFLSASESSTPEHSGDSYRIETNRKDE